MTTHSIRKTDIDCEMQQAHLDYALSVIVSCSLPRENWEILPVGYRR
jgi:DNA gyrase/topoisomerase IV subunit A